MGDEMDTNSNLQGVVIIIFIVASISYIFKDFFTSDKKSISSSSNNVDCYIVPTPEPWDCTSDCSGHQAGYNWAKRKNISNPLLCTGNSNSFIAGCEYYFQEKEHERSLMECGARNDRWDGFEYNPYE